MYYIYILYSQKASLYYVGYSSNYVSRLEEHNTQEHFNTFTSKYRPWILAAVFECGIQEKDAIKMERFIKKQKSRKLIEFLINAESVPTGALAQLVRVPDFRDLIRRSLACTGYTGF